MSKSQRSRKSLRIWPIVGASRGKGFKKEDVVISASCVETSDKTTNSAWFYLYDPLMRIPDDCSFALLLWVSCHLSPQLSAALTPSSMVLNKMDCGCLCYPSLGISDGPTKVCMLWILQNFWDSTTYKKEFIQEFPLWLSGLSTWLGSMRMWVQSLALFGGFRIWHCSELHVAVAVP